MSSLPPSPLLESPFAAERLWAAQAPFARAPEVARTIFVTLLITAMAPLAAGTVFFGWRALWVAALAMASCAVIERIYYRLTRVPALLGRSHGYLTGLLLALTLPAHVPWYVPVVGAAFAVLVGKAFFGGVGHFVWQPALVGRLAVAVLFAQQIENPNALHPGAWPVLAQNKIIVGDIRNSSYVEEYRQWRGSMLEPGKDALLLETPEEKLEGLFDSQKPQYSALACLNENGTVAPRPAALEEMQQPPISDLLYGARPGGIGETCAVIIVAAGMYLVYRHYVKWQLPAAIVLSACVVAALAPIHLQGAGETVISGWGPPGGWLGGGIMTPLSQWTLPPLLREGLDVGFLYVCYQVLSTEILLAAFFLATETTTRPVATGGQVLFGIGCGAGAMLLHLYVDVPTPAYVAVLVMNTLTPVIDSVWRPRVFGSKRWAWARKN